MIDNGDFLDPDGWANDLREDADRTVEEYASLNPELVQELLHTVDRHVEDSLRNRIALILGRRLCTEERGYDNGEPPCLVCFGQGLGHADAIIDGLEMTPQFTIDGGMTRYRQRPPWWGEVENPESRYVTKWEPDTAFGSEHG